MSDHTNDSRGHSAYDLLKDFGLPAIPGMILNAGSASRFTLFFAVAVRLLEHTAKTVSAIRDYP